MSPTQNALLPCHPPTMHRSFFTHPQCTASGGGEPQLSAASHAADGEVVDIPQQSERHTSPRPRPGALLCRVDNVRAEVGTSVPTEDLHQRVV